MSKLIFLYTMDGCPHCKDIKDKLNENNILYEERNIKDHEKEYKQFVEATSNEYLPAMTFIEIREGEEPKVQLLAPDTSFDTIDEAVDKVKEFIS
jgi:glutaredoxin